MSKILSLLFGKSSESRALISTSESLSSVSELDDEGEDCVSLESLEQGQGSTIKKGSVSSRERLLPKDSKPSQRDLVDSTSLLSTPQRKSFNLDHGGSQSEKSVPICSFEDQSLIARESFVGQSECDIDLSNCDRPWNVLLRIHRSSRKMKERRKYWRPVVVKLEEASLKFHANDFESFPPFQVVPLLWSHGFTVPNYKGTTGSHRRLLTCTLFNTTRGTTSKRVFATCPSMRKKAGLKVAKIGCTNHRALRDLVDTVQRCIFSFPGFRQRGIRYGKDRFFVDVQDVYEGVQNGRDGEIKAVTHVHVKVKALVSGSPKCSISLNNSSGFGEQEAETAKISFHKCVQEKKQLSPLVVTFVPLDNCWFEVIQMQSVSYKPPVLRCQVSLIVHVSTQIELRAQLFATTSALPEAAPLKNVILRFHVPLSMFKEGLVGNSVKNTHVSKGKLDFNSSDGTIIWSISKLPLKTGKKLRSKHRELPLASFSSHFNPTSSFNADDFTKEPVYMDFMIKRKNMVAIEEITLESEKFHNLKVNYSSFFRVSIPVHVFRIS